MTSIQPILRRGRLLAFIGALAIAVPAPALGAAGGGPNKPPHPDTYVTSSESYVESTGNISGVDFVPLINSGETAFGTMFEGIPDGIGVVPGQGPHTYVDLYVNHEQSRVPFQGFADYQDSSVSRVRVNLDTMEIMDLEVALSPDEGFIRFCSSFMAGPEHGFPQYTLLTNEESNDALFVPAGAVYGSDPFYGGANVRQAGYTVTLNTASGKVGVLAGAGRHNHENQVIVPGGWNGIYALSGDDTFTFPSSADRPNLSQLYMYAAGGYRSFLKDQGSLWAFRVTGTQDGVVDPADPFNGANDFFDIAPGDDFTGEFIPVPSNVARGQTGDAPQDALEDWSNDNNVFQFIRVEDIAYDPDDPRTVYFADTGNTRIQASPTTGRLYRGGSGDPDKYDSDGRIFKLVMNADDPTVVDSFSILADGDGAIAGVDYDGDVPFFHPDNVALSHGSLMVQEDTEGAKIWRYSLGGQVWTHIATATQPFAETSGIVDVSPWFGAGWWALVVQSHYDPFDPLPDLLDYAAAVYHGPGGDVAHTAKLEDGQLLLMYVPGS